jgi:lipopolysaccharide/colanic/teichoic acid biosynthesis glycosyltransferase
MRYDLAVKLTNYSLLARRRFQFAGALVVAAFLPFVARAALFDTPLSEPASINAAFGNAIAIAIAFWMRLSIETYPGVRSAFVIFPPIVSAHGLVIFAFLMTRLPYDRLGLALGFGLHVMWNYFVYLYAQRKIRRRIAIVPYGNVADLREIDDVEWRSLTKPRTEDAEDCHAIVADFAADLPDEWEAFLADAALSGKMVYQVKQLSESLTGRVELDHLSENSFGSLLPVRAYFHLKGLVDFMMALAILPIAMGLMAFVAIAIRVEGRGPIYVRQPRVGYAGRRITVYKFRTMRPVSVEDERRAAMTGKDDERITRVGAYLRRTRIDELPQIFNILKWQMSWIGPRPEAEVLSIWYTSELPFYRYRHVVKPGISGWAQVNQGHVAEVDEVNRKLQYDFYYIKYFSPWLDLLILFRTIKTVLTGFGSPTDLGGAYLTGRSNGQQEEQPGRV